ncbi:MAG: hypothetical protein J6V23_07095 [Bacteroidaceae bacterium]|nr:hypothetical protein [Bacteroidaceae bacterium]
MERIVYNKTLDTHKSGVQFTLQGFETADKMSRRIIISLMANGDTIDLPVEQMEAVMYVTTPNIAETSINACTIKGNTIIYDALPITEEGITTMQLKLIETRPDGVASVIATPRFSVEVTKSDVDDEGIKGTASYTAVEEALSKASAAYASRLDRIALHSDCMFYAYYADGTIYESDVLKELFLKGDVLLSQSYAKGGSGVRDGEDTDNSMYYCNVAKSMSLATEKSGENALAILDEVKKHGVYTIFTANFETGELFYESPKYKFEIDKETGELEIIGRAYTLEDTMRLVAQEWLEGFGVVFPEFKETVDKNKTDIESLTKTVADHSEKIEALDGIVLWTNPDFKSGELSSEATFEAQTIELDLSKYKTFRIVYKISIYSALAGFKEMMISLKDINYTMVADMGDLSYYRDVTISDTGINFDGGGHTGGLSGGTAAQVNYCIPCQLIGYLN